MATQLNEEGSWAVSQNYPAGADLRMAGRGALGAVMEGKEATISEPSTRGGRSPAAERVGCGLPFRVSTTP